MLINYGYEITVSVVNPTPMICLLDIHPEHRGDIRAETPLGTQPPVPTSNTVRLSKRFSMTGRQVERPMQNSPMCR
jgi:hypothetical protein